MKVRGRTEEEMIKMVLGMARRDERIRVVGLNGSRVNPNAPRDWFQDFDFAFIVTEMTGFINDERWLEVFGPRIILQKPEAMSLFPPSLGNWFSFLMLLEDGNRIDLMLIPLSELDQYLAADKLTVILLDKDGLVETLPEPSDETHWVKKPSEQLVDDCCNEFWWLAPYVAKGLARRELIYAIDHLYLMRGQLLTMISWRVGLETDFSVSVGKNHKYLDRYIPAEEFAALSATYQNGSPEAVDQALRSSLTLFRSASRSVISRMGSVYPDYDEKVSDYLECFIFGDYPATH